MTLTLHGAATAPDGSSCTGPLASHVEGFAAQLSRKGYAQNTVRAKCDVLADLSRWLERRQLPLVALDEGRLRQFQATRRRRDKARRGDPATGQQLLEYLRDRDDIAAAAQRIDRTPAACLTRDFEEFLHTERGLSRSTVVSYLLIVRCFLDERFGRKALRLEQLRPQDLHGFILREVQRDLTSIATRRSRACSRPPDACRLPPVCGLTRSPRSSACTWPPVCGPTSRCDSTAMTSISSTEC